MIVVAAVRLFPGRAESADTTITFAWAVTDAEDPLTNRGEPAALGVYFYKLVAPGATISKKMVFLK